MAVVSGLPQTVYQNRYVCINKSEESWGSWAEEGFRASWIGESDDLRSSGDSMNQDPRR